MKRAKTTNCDICEISEKCEISVDALSEAFNTFQYLLDNISEIKAPVQLI